MNVIQLLAAEAAGTARADWRVRIVRAALRAACSLAPERTSRLVERLWFTPPRARISPEIAAFLDTAEPLSLTHGDTRVAAYAWGDGPLALVMHGWGSNAGRLRSVIEALTGAGLRVIAFDAPGHGRSGDSEWGPRQANFREMAAILVALGREHGPARAIVAHSGGCTASALALRRGLVAERAVWFAPMANPTVYAARFQRALALSDEVMLRFQARSTRRLGFPWSDLDMVALPRHARTPPALVVHDRDDIETFSSDGTAVAASWPHSRLIKTQGLGHRGVLRDAKSLDAMSDFVAQPVLRAVG
ncbi:alpha/beta fold hydrolase [Tahibacter soli]|uniref:Alpha/beta fold hydrolase n=1 Tax=Tahibacter soli TaxID=2983605 RepID=A0A9X3YJT8_9GAMM|nr:alpha/beta fold hydrolase [Tahibacter soli]MDC8012520.1 alpha/beta fold hydrolase [Tahibacter soli]